MGTSVRSVVLSVSGEGFSKITKELSIIGGLIQVEMEVPYGRSREFALSAFNADSILLYYGAVTTDVNATSLTEVSIYMSPNPRVTMLKISPLYKSVGALEQVDSFDIELFNLPETDSLFGIAMRIEIDSTIISFNSCKAGGFLGTQAEAFLYPRLFPDYLAFGYSILGNQQPQGVTGSGKIARVYYTAKRAGSTTLRISRTNLTLTDWEMDSLPNIHPSDVVLENGEVVVHAQ